MEVENICLHLQRPARGGWSPTPDLRDTEGKLSAIKATKWCLGFFLGMDGGHLAEGRGAGEEKVRDRKESVGATSLFAVMKSSDGGVGR